jgi:hypothetical protein
MSAKKQFLRKMYDIRKEGNEGYLTKNAVSNMIKNEHGTKLTSKESRDIIDSLVSENLIEKTPNGIRISKYGMSTFEIKQKGKKQIKYIFIIGGIVILASLIYYLYS